MRIVNRKTDLRCWSDRKNVRKYDPKSELRSIIAYRKVKTSMKQGKRDAIEKHIEKGAGVAMERNH